MVDREIDRQFMFLARFRTPKNVEFVVDILEKKVWTLSGDTLIKVKVQRRTLKLITVLLSGYAIDNSVIKPQKNVIPCLTEEEVHNRAKDLNLNGGNAHTQFSIFRNIFGLEENPPLIGSDDVGHRYWTFDSTYHNAEFEKQEAEKWRRLERERLIGAPPAFRPESLTVGLKARQEVAPRPSSTVPETLPTELGISGPGDPRAKMSVSADTSKLTRRVFITSLATISLLLLATLALMVGVFTPGSSSNRLLSSKIISPTEQIIQYGDVQYLLSVNSQKENSESKIVLDVKILNDSDSSVVITKAVLIIKKCTFNPSPILRVLPKHRRLVIENVGWGTVKTGRITFHRDSSSEEDILSSSSNYLELPSFEKQTETASFDPILRSWGVNIDSANRFRIEKDGEFDFKFFVDEREVSGPIFESERKLAGKDIQNGAIAISGTIEYEGYSEGQNNVQQYNEHFQCKIGLVSMPNGMLQTENEALLSISGQYDMNLHISEIPYDLELPLSHTIGPGEQDRFSILVDADKSAIATGDLCLYVSGKKCIFPNLSIQVAKFSKIQE